MRFERAALLALLVAGCGGDPNGDVAPQPNTSDGAATTESTTGVASTSASAAASTNASSSTTMATTAIATATSVSATSTSGAGGTTLTSTGSATSSTGGIPETTTTGQGSGQASLGGAGGTTTGDTGGTGGTGNPGGCEVMPLTDEFRQAYDDLDPFYQKYADARGLPVVSSMSPADEALTRVCELVIDMVSARPDVVEALVERHVRFAVIGEDELTNDIPEFSYLDDYINQRARGLGGLPAASCAEESILCNTELDRWRGEGICVHEFAHTISMGGLFAVDPTFEDRLRDAFENAQSSGLFENTYAMENLQEYWAEGVQDWYYTNLESDPPNGIHNFVDRREELMEYDPALYALIAEFLPDEPQFVDCYSDE
ncbi:MAG TPA: hypothetical protein VI197_00810 [Polyangiaceae bacterium]